MIMTVGGEIGPEDLGVVAMSEYTFCAVAGWEHDPWISFDRPQAVDAILSSLQDFKESGGRTIVDQGGILLGRDANLLKNLSSSTGIHIIASTGFASDDKVPGQFLAPWVRKGKEMDRKGGTLRQVLDAEHLADIFLQELTQGMVVPGMIRTKIKAGYVRAGSGWDKLSEAEEISLRAAAKAARRAGVAVSAHGIGQARRLVEVMMQEGLKPGRMVIGHCDDGRAIDLKRDRELAGKGAYIAYDHIGWEDRSFPHGVADERRVELVKAMVEAGFAERIILSCSAIGYAIGVPQPKHTYAYLLNRFIPKLERAGVSGNAIDTILRENPKRLLSQESF